MFKRVLSKLTTAKSLRDFGCFVLLCAALPALANVAPVITSSPETKVTEDNRYEYKIVANDEDGDTIIYTVPTLPAFLAYNSSTQTISGTPTNSDVGFHSVRVEVSDGVNTVNQQYSLEVVNANDAPTLVQNIANQTITEDESFSLNVISSFADADAADTLTYTAENMPSGLSISSSGLITGAPDNTAALASPFTVKIIATDTANASVDTTFQIVVINVNDAPQPFDDTVLVNEDTATFADILANDIDVDNDIQPSTLFIVSPPTNGEVSFITSTGLLTYIPNADFAGTDSLQYRISDPGGLTGTATVTFNVVNANDAPVANNDVFLIEEDIATNLQVLANDTDADVNTGDAPQASQIVIELSPSNGSVTVTSTGIQYVPNIDYVGTDSFFYRVADLNGAFSNTAKVLVTVGPVNDVPKAGDDIAATLEDQSTYFIVLNNDSDTEDTTISASSIAILNQPANGSVRIDIDGGMTYTPDTNFNGTDTFQYTITDSDGLTSAAATVTVTVNPVNDAPQANSDSAEVDEDNSVDVSVLGNDTDIDGNSEIQASSLTVQNQPNNGTTFIDTASGIIRYTPNADFSGTDSFTYQVSDSGGLNSNSAQVQITVNAVNDSPRLTSDAVTTDEDTAITISVLDNDVDIDGTIDSVSLNVTQQPVSGTVSINSSGQIIYTPSLNFHGSDQFSYNVSDNLALAAEIDATVLVTINSVNDAPTVNSGTGETFEDNETTITLIGSDVDDDALTYTIVQQPTHGTLSGSGTSRTYTPDANYNGSDRFIYKANDGSLDSLSNIVTINIISVNDRPVATSQTVSVDEDNALSIRLSGSDIDGDQLSYAISDSDIQGTISGTPPNITYTPPENFNGQEALFFIANDGKLDSSRGTVTIDVNPVNDAPVADDQGLFVSEDEFIAVTLTASDIDEDSLTYSVVNQPASGTITGTAPNLTYTPNEHFNGSDSFTFVANDGSADSNEATISLDVSPSPDAPTADAVSVSGSEDSDIAITLSGSDPDDNELTFNLSTTPNRGSLSGTAPNLIYTPQADYHGDDSFQYTVSDGTFESDPQTVSISVSPVNDPPVAVDDSYERSMSGLSFVILDVLSNDTDIDGDQLTVLSAEADIGSVSVNDNKLRYAPPTGFIGDVLMEYTMSDTSGETAQAMVLLSVEDNTSVNDPTIDTPDDVSIVSSGRLTHVDLGSATALDRHGNIIPVELIDGKRPFKPGAHTVFWRATDDDGNTTTSSQRVNVFPLISLNQGETIEEGGQGVIKVKLNGPAPLYPVVVPYSVSGTATAGIDYELASGEIRIDSGREFELKFDTFTDSITEADEEVVVTLGDTPYKSANDTYRAKIVEGNVAPRASLFAMQNGQYRLRIINNDDVVTVMADIEDANANDSHTIEWMPDERIERTNTTSEADFQFVAKELATGTYHIAAKITDDNTSPLSVDTKIFIEVLESLPTLGSNDTDGDMISDADEGHGDSDRDHIPNYLDPNDDCAVIPERNDTNDSFLLEGESSGCLRVGDLAGASSDGGALVDQSTITDDPDTNITGGLFDFQVHGLDENSLTYAIVIPQREPIPAGALYRKYSAEKGWYTFIEDDNNKVYSSAGSKGVCPAPKDQSWSQGLTLGHWCVQLLIEDGGANDDDGIANGSISDPGGVAVYQTGNSQPQAENDTGEMTWNSSEEFGVLANDSDPDFDQLTLITVTAGLGEAEIVQDRRVLYTALENYVGEDIVEYTISDGNGGLASASLTINIKGNAAPVANNDNASTTNDKPITIDVLGNDTDIDGDSLSLESVTADSGTVEITSDNKVRFVPKAGFVGTVTVLYTVVDSRGAESEGKLFISVAEAPVVEPTEPTDNGGSDSGGGVLYFGLLLIGLAAMRRKKH